MARSEAPCLVLFTKPARPGRVKTRLIGDGRGELTAVQAAELHAAFLADVTAELRQGSFVLRLAWAVEAAEIPPDGGWRQADGDLGDRLFGGLRRAAEEHPVVAAVGSDHPEIRHAAVGRAFELLGPSERSGGGAEVVLGPSHDGGYYLVAVRRESLHRELFTDIPWSTSGVLYASRRRCAELGLRLAELAPAHDVDVAADLEALAARLARNGGGCAATRALLRRWGRLP